jgi:hypothetical protein
MKLIRFSLGDAKPSFGVVIGDHAIAFTSLQQRSGITRTDLSDSKAVFAWLEFIAPIKPGSVMGFGNIPDCTGCDHDDFIDPGAEIQITFERLGTLRCHFAEPTGRLLPSRWPVRKPLQRYHG